ncbi:sigma-54-dependent transcriptional regulator [Pelodictyon phaeoclathratiforme]|uniref:Two component, sigma54 specific, transcriptional regulator, Fis family n=1 Tax=Pelodictyon phaeoclathratiforme (strain DSM 5477 / BU-1) TaxID=324925 RepID=B4SBH8_PELPB|nr:sigma-54 dependent transcriptional regulator [Pelodictyon phaeoclathratiforme]ACF44032.1 two component, sigma54 specific, transcriptional regulator, Fis family [Pelodictyon phaeoclathratiforme BU-1]MBV5288288.1 sigma-54-dependent Fis family transcriptional regulator [Pelodictyon phaeoclathratiforme]
MQNNYISQIKVLILDDEIDFTNEISDYLKNTGFIPFSANTPEEGYAILSKYNIDLLILDVRLPGTNGLDILKNVKSLYPGIEVIMVSAHGDMDTVIDSIRLGAFDYLRKPMRYIDIQIAIERTQKYLKMQRNLAHAEEKYSLITSDIASKIGRHCIGKSKQIIEIYELAKTASEYSDINVLITGESGTGKEIFAKLIHYMSKQKDNYFGAINCSAISDALIESEFFGHKKGAFTGAISDKKGLFEICNEGTLFLDEIADMPLNLQSKILRAIEEKTITRVGDTKQIQTKFRLIAATNCDLQKMVDEKKFRLDLLHRLNTLHIHIPPLRERIEDIGPLFIDFTKEFSEKINKPIESIGDDVFVALEKYSFPGNIRELRNLAERAIILSKGNSLQICDFPLPVVNKISNTTDSNTKIDEEDAIHKTLEECEYNQVMAAEILGISRYALIRRMRKYKIDIKRNEAER